MQEYGNLGCSKVLDVGRLKVIANIGDRVDLGQHFLLWKNM